MNNATRTASIAVNDRVQIIKGCKARELDKGVTARVVFVTELGADYSHSVRVVLQVLNGFKSGRQFSFFARHVNRLSDPIVRMNDGNPSNTIEIRRTSPVQPKPAIDHERILSEQVRRHVEIVNGVIMPVNRSGR